MRVGTTISFQSATFSPSDLEALTGLSVDGQRDWRKRGLLPKKTDRGWTRFTLEDAAFVMTMKAFKDRGVLLEDAHSAASMAVLPICAFANRHSQESERPAKVPHFVPANGDVPDRFVAIVRTHKGDRVLRCRSLSGLEGYLDENRDSMAMVIVIFDCLVAALRLQEVHGGPLVTQVIEE